MSCGAVLPASCAPSLMFAGGRIAYLVARTTKMPCSQQWHNLWRETRLVVTGGLRMARCWVSFAPRARGDAGMTANGLPVRSGCAARARESILDKPCVLREVPNRR